MLFNIFFLEVATNLRESDDFVAAKDEVATALREFHELLTLMKAEASEEAMLRDLYKGRNRQRFRGRTDAREYSALLGEQAEEELGLSPRLEAAEDARRSTLRRGHRTRGNRCPMYSSKPSSMLEDAHAEPEDANDMAEAVEKTIVAKRSEFEEHLVAVTSLAKSTARAWLPRR